MAKFLINHRKEQILTQFEMVGFKKLHSTAWACSVCEELSSHPDVNALLEHLKIVHSVQGVTIDSDGGAWISETTN